MRIEHAEIAAFADELFQKRDYRAFAQVVCILFKRQAEDT